VVSQNEYAYKELNIFWQTIPSSGVAWNSSPSFVIIPSVPPTIIE
jgi:hypothetical protein